MKLHIKTLSNTGASKKFIVDLGSMAFTVIVSHARALVFIEDADGSNSTRILLYRRTALSWLIMHEEHPDNAVWALVQTAIKESLKVA